MKIHLERRSYTAEGARGCERNSDCAALPSRGHGLPVSALVITEEEVVISIDGDSLIGVRGNGEDRQMAGQRTWSGKDRLSAAGRECHDGAARRWRREGTARLGKWTRRWLRGPATDASKDAS